MARKAKKGEKVNLSEFLGDYTNKLPSAPSGAAPPEFEGRRRQFPNDDSEGRFGRDRGDDFEGGRRRYDDGPVSRADEDGEWRKSRAPSGPPPQQFSAGDDSSEWRRREPSSRDSFHREPHPPSAADDASEWRRRDPLPPRQEGPPSAAEEASEWRRREPMQTRQELPPSAADEATEWRRKEPVFTRPEPPVSVADEAAEWRRKEPLRVAPPAPTPISDADDNWRKVQPAAPAAAAKEERPSESNDWRSNKPTPTSAPSVNEPRSRQADVVTDWRAPSNKIQQKSLASKTFGPRIPLNAPVITPFGKGVFLEHRPSDSIRVVKLDFGAEGYLRAEDVIQGIPDEVQTPRGKAKFVKISFPDRMCELILESGEEVSFPLSELTYTPLPPPPGAEKPNRNKRGDKAERPERRGRRFGDNERDLQRESVFSDKKDQEDNKHASRSELFKAFSRDRKEHTDRVQPSSSPPPIPEDRDKLFAAFRGGKKSAEPREPRMTREDKDRPFAAFNQGKRDADARGSAPPFGRFAQPERPAFPAFDRPERPQFPGFDRQSASAPAAFSGFNRGDDRRRDAPIDSAPLPMRRAPEDKYVGGMERIAASRRQPSDGFPALEKPSTPPAPIEAPAPKVLPKGSKWAEDDEPLPAVQQPTKKKATVDAAPAAPVKKIPLDFALNSIGNIIKEFMISEDKTAAVNALMQISTEDDNELLASFVSMLTPNASSGAKPKKLVISLLQEMSSREGVTDGTIAEGLIRTVEANPSEEAVVKEVFAGVQEKVASFATIALRGVGQKLRDDQTSSSTGGEKDVDSLALEVFASPDGLTKMKEMKFGKLPGAAAAAVKAALKDAKLDDATCPWVEKYAKPLALVLASASRQDQLEAIEVIQLAFNDAKFPKANGVGIIDTVFTKLYNLDILPNEAFIEWKDDLSRETPGRNTAIIQTTNFFFGLEAEEEDYDDEDEDDE